MAQQRTMKLDDELFFRLQKIKMAYLERYHKTITFAEVVTMIMDKNILMMQLLNDNKH